MSIGRAMDRAYILNTIKEAGRQKEASSGCSASLDRLQKKGQVDRLQERQVGSLQERQVESREGWPGKRTFQAARKAPVNQQRIGVASVQAARYLSTSGPMAPCAVRMSFRLTN